VQKVSIFSPTYRTLFSSVVLTILPNLERLSTPLRQIVDSTLTNSILGVNIETTETGVIYFRVKYLQWER